MSLREKRIAVVGATGAVGREMLNLLASDGVEAHNISAWASARSAGARLPYGDAEVEVSDIASMSGACAPDLALFAASSGIVKQWGPALVVQGAVVVDNSSAFRMEPDVELVVPEVNGDAVRSNTNARVIANPNCSTIIMLVGITPIREAFGCSHVVVSTYQAVSGAGIEAMNELREQSLDVLNGKRAEPRIFAEACAFNVFSHNSPINEQTGLNVEEAKMIEETRKIWRDSSVKVRPTCIRVPVLRAHCESITITTEREVSRAGVIGALSKAPGVRILDDRATNDFPTPLKASGGAEVLAGRIRVPDERTVELFVAGDQLLKGAALNAVQIARLVFG